MKVTSAINVGSPLVITTTVAFGELNSDLRNGVEWLMDVSDVMDNETECERELIVLVSE